MFPLGFRETVWETGMRGIHAAPDPLERLPLTRTSLSIKGPEGHGWPAQVSPGFRKPRGKHSEAKEGEAAEGVRMEKNSVFSAPQWER